VSNCSLLNGCPGDVNIDQWDIANAGSVNSHLNAVPANGSFIRSVQTDGIYEVAGGAPLYVSNCSLLNGCPGDVNIDQWDIANAGSVNSHLSKVPSNGTVVKCLPSDLYWRFSAGERTSVGATVPAADVDDVSVNTYPLAVSISTKAFGNGKVGTRYDVRAMTSGGVAPFLWTRVGGNKPPGLSFSATGVWTGVPTAAGTYAFTLQVRDKNGATAEKQLSIKVAAR
jgi:hypothetical protein